MPLAEYRLGRELIRTHVTGIVSSGNPLEIAEKQNRIALLVSILPADSSDYVIMKRASGDEESFLVLNASLPTVYLSLKQLGPLVSESLEIIQGSGDVSVTVTEFTLGNNETGINAIYLPSNSIGGPVTQE